MGYMERLQKISIREPVLLIFVNEPLKRVKIL